jgi:uncharacterized Zn-finger protein
MNSRIEKVVITEIFYAKDDFDKGDTKKESISCYICKKLFSTKGSLTRHTRSIHSLIKFKCDDCDHTFSRPDALKAHKCKVSKFVTHNNIKVKGATKKPQKIRSYRFAVQ